MPKLFVSSLAALLLAIVSPAQEATGDVVVLNNGDRLTGTVTSITADKVMLDTAAAGTVEIDLAEVANVTTTAPLKLATEDGGKFEATVQSLSDGKLRIGTGAAARDVAAASLVKYRPPVEWSGSFNVGGALSTGNTERRSGNASADLMRRTDRTRLSLTGTWDYGEEKQDTDGDGAVDDFVLSQRRTFGSAQFDYFLTDDLYALAQVSAENDAFSDLKLRLTYGAGLGYVLFDGDCFGLQGEVGLSYVDEARYVSEDNEYLAARIAYALRWHITDDTHFLQDTSVFPSLEDKDDFYARVDSRIRTSLTDSMFGQLQHIFAFDNTPATGLQRDDHRFVLSVGWSF